MLVGEETVVAATMLSAGQQHLRHAAVPLHMQRASSPEAAQVSDILCAFWECSSGRGATSLGCLQCAAVNWQ